MDKNWYTNQNVRSLSFLYPDLQEDLEKKKRENPINHHTITWGASNTDVPAEGSMKTVPNSKHITHGQNVNTIQVQPKQAQL